jgi:hypothetical protein
MTALGRIEQVRGISAMNSINSTILGSIFMPFFYGSTLASLALVIIGLVRRGEPGAMAMLVGGLIYIAGMFLCTMFFNVPLNNALAAMIRGRAHLYGGDGQLRIWHVGTHHDYEPDESSSDSVLEWLEAGVKKSERSKSVNPASTVYLFADFLVCPTEPFKKGSVQRAKVLEAKHRRYVPFQ